MSRICSAIFSVARAGLVGQFLDLACHHRKAAPRPLAAAGCLDRGIEGQQVSCAGRMVWISSTISPTCCAEAVSALIVLSASRAVTGGFAGQFGRRGGLAG